MPAKKHFLLLLAAALWLNAAAPVMNPLETEAEYRRMLDFCRGSACPELAALLNNFGGFYFAQARYKDAESLLKEALVLGQGEQAAFTMTNLAALYRITGRFADAAPLFDCALHLLEEKNGGELPRVLTGAALLALDPRADMQDVALGEARCRRALALVEADSAEAATARNTLGAILEIQARFVEAQAELETALAIRERLFGSGDPLVAETLDKLGLVYRQRGHLVEAEGLYQRAIAILRARPPVVELGTALNNLGNVLAARGRRDEAETALRGAIEVWEKLLGPEHPNIAAALSNLSTLARSRHHYTEAEQLLGKALEMDRKVLPTGNTRIGLELNNAGTLLAARKRYAEAEEALRESVAILQRTLPADHPEVGRVLVNLGEVLRLEKKTVEAEDRYRAGLEILTRAWGPDDVRLLAWLGPYAGVARAREDYAEAAKADMQAMKIRVREARN
jgi:tetratricopeptide (TPR) repeat protein